MENIQNDGHARIAYEHKRMKFTMARFHVSSLIIFNFLRKCIWDGGILFQSFI